MSSDGSDKPLRILPRLSARLPTMRLALVFAEALLDDRTGCLYLPSREVLRKFTFSFDGKRATRVDAHRLVYALLRGPLPPKNQTVGHSCGNGLCIRPSHLTVVDFKDVRQVGGRKPKLSCQQQDEVYAAYLQRRKSATSSASWRSELLNEFSNRFNTPLSRHDLRNIAQKKDKGRKRSRRDMEANMQSDATMSRSYSTDDVVAFFNEINSRRFVHAFEAAQQLVTADDIAFIFWNPHYRSAINKSHEKWA